MSANSSATSSNKLQKKDAEVFKSIVACYEQKQYAKGLKNAEIILKKLPNHGETLAMKGLILNCLLRKEEAYEFVKIGLKNDLKSHICWHVYGLLYRSDTNYKEAIKCYLNALRIDPGNQNILRDLSWLQIQMRDIPGFIISRRKILEAKINIRINWVSFAAANYLGGYYSVAYDVISKYYDTTSSSNEKVDKYEEGELLLFQNLCLEKQKKYLEGMAHLEKNSSLIVDKYAMNIKNAEYLVRIGNFDEAKTKWMNLVLYQIDNYRLHNGLQIACLELSGGELLDDMFGLKQLELVSTTLPLTDNQRKSLYEVYYSETFNQPKYSKSKIITKIKLSFLQGDEFQTLLESYMKDCLTDGIPALYHDVCSLIRNPVTITTSTSNDPETSTSVIENNDNCMNNIISDKTVLQTKTVMVPVTDTFEFRAHPLVNKLRTVLLTYITNLQQYDSFDSIMTQTDDKKTINVPNAILWSKFLYCHLLESSGELSKALEIINECIDHTPTGLDMYMKKAKILKKKFLFDAASQTVDLCRSLDLQDRYLNNKATKYLLRADLISDAMETIALFVKHDPTNEKNDPQKTLSDLQCNWYEIELAQSYSRCKQWGYALKKYYDVLKHFSDYMEDMFDFHNYVQRKNTLRMYMNVLNMQDNLFAHKFFQRAAVGAMTIYLYLTDFIEDIDGLGHLSAAERKKERAKLKKKKSAITTTGSSGGESGNSNSTVVADAPSTTKQNDTDMSGEKYLTKGNFLQECYDVWCQQYLITVVDKLDLDTLCIMCEVYFRKSKPMQMLRCLSTGLRRNPSHPGLTVMFVKLYRRLYSLDSGTKFTFKEGTMTLSILKEEVESLLTARITNHNQITSTTTDVVHNESGSTQVSTSDRIQEYIKKLDTSKSQQSLPYLLSHARISLLMSSGKALASTKISVADNLLNSLKNDDFWNNTSGITVPNILEILRFMTLEIKSEPHTDQLKALLLIQYPEATKFLPKQVSSVTSMTLSNDDNQNFDD